MSLVVQVSKRRYEERKRRAEARAAAKQTAMQADAANADEDAAAPHEDGDDGASAGSEPDRGGVKMADQR